MGLFERIHVHVPFAALERTLPVLLERRLCPEIYLAAGDVEALAAGAGEAAAAALGAAGLATTVHAPFGGLDPGSPDESRRRATGALMRRTLGAAAVFCPAVVVFHPGRASEESPALSLPRLRASLRTWGEMLPLPPALAGTTIAIENIYDADPDGLAAILRELPAPTFGCCFDTGHFQMFTRRPLEQWLERLGPWIRETHLHDNGGEADEHLPPGQGRFDFPRYFRLLAALPRPVIGTLEMHSLPHIHEGLAALRSYGVL